MNKPDLCIIGDVTFGDGRLALISGPCMAESLELCLSVAHHMKSLCDRFGVGYVFKASFDKANRSSTDSHRGPGMKDGLAWLAKVAREVRVPVLTDIHEPHQAAPAAEVVDCLQIPAFLCRQTDLLIAAGKTGKAVNIKKGQFMAPWDMKHAVAKVNAYINHGVVLTERGTFFGYNRLVTDLRSIPQMQEFAPVIFDATHSVQQPGGLGAASGGEREYAPLLAKAALAAGADGLFIETHPAPEKALSDAASQIALNDMETVLQQCVAVFEAVRGNEPKRS
ncbi:MAG: 3-deoxy-8-phosphooctulonate synthase [Phycisphaerae bacterium]|nr:3-deoxy-8-phosphooctulonate synthase [Phycisphaerae bacterium]